MSLDLSKVPVAPEWVRQLPLPPTCLLCGADSEIIGVWVWPKSNGGQRLVFYTLCRPCTRHADERVDRIERILEGRLAQLN